MWNLWNPLWFWLLPWSRTTSPSPLRRHQKSPTPRRRKSPATRPKRCGGSSRPEGTCYRRLWGLSSACHIYIYSDWFTTSSPNAKDPHPIANGRRPHLFTTQLLLNRNPSNQSFPNAGHGKRLWLKRYSPPSFHPSWPQQTRLRKMSSHGVHMVASREHHSRKVLEIHTPKT